MIRAIRRAGFRKDSSRGDGGHVAFRKEGRCGIVIVPVHSEGAIDPKTLQSILHQAGMTVERLGQREFKKQEQVPGTDLFGQDFGDGTAIGE